MASTTTATTAPKSDTRSSKEALHRLVRTLSGRSVNGSGAATNDGPVQTTASSTSLQRTRSATSALSQTDKSKLSVSERLKNLGKDLPRILKRNSKAGAASPRVTTSSALPDTPDSGYASPINISYPSTSSSPGPSSPPHSAGAPGHAKMLSMVAELTENEESPSSSAIREGSPSPNTLARRLQDLIDSLPFPSIPSDPTERRPPINLPKPPARDKNGKPIPPTVPTPIKDTSLIALLSSATFMNGAKDAGGKPRPSIWSILEGLGAPPHGFPPEESAPGQPEGGGSEGGGEAEHDENPPPEEEGEPDIFSDNSSVMVYSPLIPGREDHVELAELIPVSVEEEILDSASPVAGTSWTAVWPLSTIFSQATATPSPVAEATVERRSSGDTVMSPRITTVDSLGRRVRVHTVRAWVPSDAKLSVQAMWWGYRLYLPPPVLAILSDKTLEATKRAAMLTTALTWFFNNLPINALPVAVRPAALLLQRLAPYLGYIGTFISWSWSAIKSYDVGFGVTLTATWLLPIALIPGTWHEYDFPKSPTPSPPAQLPPTDTPAPAPDTPLPTSPAPPSPSEPPTEPHTPAPTSPSEPPNSPPPLPGLPTPAPTLPDTPSSPPADAHRSPWSPSSPRVLARKLFFSSSSSPSLSSTASTPKVASIPVPVQPIEFSPVPPVASPLPVAAVPIGSPLMDELLLGPVLGTVPLPDEDDVPVVVQRKKKSKAKVLFGKAVK